MSVNPPPQFRLLFVCVENANRSQMAAAFARLHGGDSVEAYSAGSRPAANVNPKAIDAMREVGYDLSWHKPIAVDALPNVPFDFVATMGCGDACPGVAARHRADWQIPDPKHMSPTEFRQVRDLVEQKVLEAFATVGIQRRFNVNRAAAHAETHMKKRLLTFKSGGWVLMLMALVCMGMLAWAGTMMVTLKRPPGDGKNIETYGFALNNLQVSRDLVAAAAAHRDPVPVMTNPSSSELKDAQKANDPKYGKYLVPADLVIGVALNGEARAYPLQVLYVHEIVNDTLGGVPIAITHNWLCDSTVVFERRIAGRNERGVHGNVAEFAVSGLVYNSNLLMYDRQEPLPRTERSIAPGSLWLQLTGAPISGIAVERGEALAMVPYQLSRFDEWVKQHPDTTVLNRDLRLAQRYRKATPTQYFQSPDLIFPVHPLPPQNGPAAKSHILAVRVGEERRVYEMARLRQRGLAAAAEHDQSVAIFNEKIGGTTVQFSFDPSVQTVRITVDAGEVPWHATHAFWFAWHAMYPDDELSP